MLKMGVYQNANNLFFRKGLKKRPPEKASSFLTCGVNKLFHDSLEKKRNNVITLVIRSHIDLKKQSVIYNVAPC